MKKDAVSKSPTENTQAGPSAKRFQAPQPLHPLRRHARLIAVIVFLTLLFTLFEFSGLRQHFTLSYVQMHLRDHQIEGLLFFVLFFSLGNLIQIPGWIFLAAAVLTLGELMGGIATYIAANISCLLTFVTIRLIGGDALRRIDKPIAQRILGQLDAQPLRSVILLRVLFQTVPALNYALALSGLKLRHYLLGTLLGLPLPIALYCIFFDYLAKGLHLTT